MKGIYVYESETHKGAVDCLELADIVQSFTLEFAPGTITEEVKVHALVSKETKAKCSSDDTYDFETGALIALMKMCDKEKVENAYRETFFPSGVNEKCPYYEPCHNRELTKIKHLKEKVDDLYAYNKGLIEEIDQKNHEIISLKALRLTNEALKKDNESFRKSLEKCKEENERLKNTRDLLTDKNNELIEENKELHKNIDELFESEQHSKSELGRLYFEKHRLEEKVEKLKLDCEKLQKGYSAGLGRLVNINGVNYRECDEKGRVVWMTSQPESFSFFADYIDTDTINTLISWHKKPTSKREQMWDDILKEGRTPVYVERKDVHDFLEECQIAGVKWSSGKMPLETMPFHMSDGYDGLYFFVMTSLDISKCKHGTKEFRHVMTWWMTASDEEARNSIKYIRPMRWDLFKKGRLVVKVDAHNYKEFYEKCESVIGRKPRYMRTDKSFTVYYKNGTFHERPYDEKIPYKYKVVNWEDVK